MLLRDHDGWILALDGESSLRKPRISFLFAPGSNEAQQVVVDNLSSNSVWIRDAPGLFTATVDASLPYGSDEQLVRLTPVNVAADTPARQTALEATSIYPLEWQPDRLEPYTFPPPRALNLSGCGVLVTDTAGTSIIHTGQYGRKHYVIRRLFPDGSPIWLHVHDGSAIGVVHLADIIVVASISAELIALDAKTGEVLYNSVLTIDSHPVIPLSIARRTDDQILVGTADGRILIIEIHR